jgi:ubiquinone/menaquinone biosynthesis C-methylase UbiE
LEKNSVSEVDEITKSHPMEYLMNHPFFIIRHIERARRKELLNLINPQAGEVISDVGCDYGHLLMSINQECPEAKLYGIDLSSYALQKARERVKNAELILCDACNIKLPDNSVDVAISSNVLEHLPDPQKGFNELVRITKPNGRIILNLPNEKRIIKTKKLLMNLGLKWLLGNLTLVTPGHLHYPDKEFVQRISVGYDIKRLYAAIYKFYIFAEVIKNEI